MKKLFAMLLVLIMLLSCTACGGNESENASQGNVGNIRWPNTELVSRLPMPETLNGEVQWESAEEYCVDLTDVTQEQFDDYIDACMDKGFVVDYYRDSSEFWAYDKNGYDLSVDYDNDTKIMSISIDAPEKEDSDTDSDQGNTTTTTTTAAEDTTTTTEAATTTTAKSEGIDSDFKKAMDSYEAFMGKYVEFMKKYQKNPTDLGLLADYATYMSDYTKFCNDFAKWEDEDLNAAELAYYLDVQTRVSKKLLEVAG